MALVADLARKFGLRRLSPSPQPSPTRVGEGGEGGEFCADFIADSIDVFLDVLVSETKYVNFDQCELFTSRGVVVRTLGTLVLGPIQLECEARLGTIEIQHKPAYRMLTPELETREGSPSQACPKQLL